MLGSSLASICDAPHMPSKRTIVQWLADPENADFRERYYNARRVQAELRIDEIFDIADNAENDYIDIHDDDGELIERRPNNEHIQRSRVRIDTRKWFAARMLPRIYGEKTLNEIDVTGDLAELLKKASDRDGGLPKPRGKVIEHDE